MYVRLLSRFSQILIRFPNVLRPKNIKVVVDMLKRGFIRFSYMYNELKPVNSPARYLFTIWLWYHKYVYCTVIRIKLTGKKSLYDHVLLFFSRLENILRICQAKIYLPILNSLQLIYKSRAVILPLAEHTQNWVYLTEDHPISHQVYVWSTVIPRHSIVWSIVTLKGKFTGFSAYLRIMLSGSPVVMALASPSGDHRFDSQSGGRVKPRPKIN